MDCVKVLLIDPYRLVREGIKQILAGTRFTVVAECGDLGQGLASLEGSGEFDLVMIDLSMEGASPTSVLEAVRAAAGGAKVVALTSSASDLRPQTALRMGICALLIKDISPGTLVHSLELVIADERILPIHSVFFGSSAVDGEGIADGGDAADFVLSDGETAVLRHLAAGLPNKMIARELNVPEATVKAHVKTLMRKLHVDNRTQAAIWCLQKEQQARALLGPPPSSDQVWRVAADKGQHPAPSPRARTASRVVAGRAPDGAQ